MSVINSLSLVALLVLQGGLAVLLAWKRVYKRFPWFFTYTVFSLLAGTVKLFVRKNALAYFNAYWSAEALYALLGFLAVYEAFRWVFRHFYLMWWWFKYLLPGIGTLMLAIAIIKGLLFPPIEVRHDLAIIYVSEMAVRCLQGGIFALFVVLVRLHSLPARTYAFGISLGFAISAFGIFLAVSVRSEFGTKVAPLVKLLPAVAYMVAVGIWLAFVIRPEPPDPFEGLASSVAPERVIEILDQYTRQLKDLFKRCSPTSS